MTDSLLLERDGAVVRLRLHRPELHNAFDAALIAALTGALDRLKHDEAVRVVVLEGAGASFSAGADLNWMRGMAAAGEAENRADALALARLMRTLDELPKPTIARVHGAAFGGGVGLVACCDIAIGVPEAKFGLTESKLGLLPAVISPYVIAAIGTRHARRYFATAEIFDAAQAQRIGLLHEVVAADTLDAAVERQVALLLKAGPVASAQAKALVRAVATASERDNIDNANADLIARLRISPEGQEGLSAFLDKRAPRWTHHTRSKPMLDHVGIPVSDYARSKVFYTQALAPLGIGLVTEVTPEQTGHGSSAGFGSDGTPYFWFEDNGAPGTRTHVAFVVKTRARVDAFHAAALTAGARDNGAPGLRPHYHADYYAAFVLDPDGHNIEAICHAPLDGKDARE